MALPPRVSSQVSSFPLLSFACVFVLFLLIFIGCFNRTITTAVFAPKLSSARCPVLSAVIYASSGKIEQFSFFFCFFSFVLECFRDYTSIGNSKSEPLQLFKRRLASYSIPPPRICKGANYLKSYLLSETFWVDFENTFNFYTKRKQFIFSVVNREKVQKERKGKSKL